MAFITSRNGVLPDTAEGLASALWFNLWPNRLWPYNELELGDTVYWYHSLSKCIVWRSHVVDVNRFPYRQKDQVKKNLNLNASQAAEPYFVKAKEPGFCLAYKVEALESMSIRKPEGLRFPQKGWLKITDDVVQAWPGILPAASPINAEDEDWTDDEVDEAIRANRLRIGIVPTDNERAMVRQRKGQSRLHELTVENYGGCCAVCDVTDPVLLVASHIVGWAEAPEHRGDLTNIFCLCRPHDALFEAGYWSLGDDLRLLKKKYVTSKTLRSLLDRMTSFRSPLEFPPAPRFVERHRARAGLKS